MSLLIQYLIKLSISLAIVWLFYQFILRKLTFYNSNRWYLIAYTLLSFFIPFINISILLENNSGANKYIQRIQLNGKEYPKSYITYSDIMKGGELVIEMGATPSKTWGVNPSDRPR